MASPHASSLRNFQTSGAFLQVQLVLLHLQISCQTPTQTSEEITELQRRNGGTRAFLLAFQRGDVRGVTAAGTSKKKPKTKPFLMFDELPWLSAAVTTTWVRAPFHQVSTQTEDSLSGY